MKFNIDFSEIRGFRRGQHSEGKMHLLGLKFHTTEFLVIQS
jgi:hypothetical protein